jgi:UDP-N-acetylglucosamine 1-carboxyvinyltransferase
MASIHICGGQRLRGEVQVQGSKNAALPVMAASVLIRGVTILFNCPKIEDVYHMIKILGHLGVESCWEKEALVLDASSVCSGSVSVEDAVKMRSSIILLGALLGRVKEAEIPYPGGCTIGARPVDWHIAALKQLNVQIEERENSLFCETTGIKGGCLKLPYPSVGVTENIILASVLADLCTFLNCAGADITGAGTPVIKISGVRELKGIQYRIMPDRIVAGTYLAAAAATGGSIMLHGISMEPLRATVNALAETGCGLIIYEESIKIVAPSLLTSVPYIETQPYPGFPTDMQSQLMVCLCAARGDSSLTENVFENRFKIVPELVRMGARISVDGRTALIHGDCPLHGCEVAADDLRGGAALVIAGLMADGETIVKNSNHIERGYENICLDLQQLGAAIMCAEQDKMEEEQCHTN